MNYKIPYLVGSRTPTQPAGPQVHWEHTQNPVYEETQPTFNHAPLATLMALAWRIREFTVSGSCSVKTVKKWHWARSGEPLINGQPGYPGVIPPTPVTDTFEAHIDVSEQVVPLFTHLPSSFWSGGPSEDELDVLYANIGWLDRTTVGRGDIMGSGTYESDSTGSPLITLENGSPFRWIADGHSGPTDYISDPYYDNRFYNYLRATAGFGASAEYTKFDPTSSPTSPYLPQIGCSMNARGLGAAAHYEGKDGFFTFNPVIAPIIRIPMTVYYENRTYSEWVEDSFEVTEAKAEFTAIATKFWPYKNKSGQPVYDTTSGAQINDPFA